nr:ribose-phosphate pyrophosphokinase-like domain-containing protein [Rickettsia canadensis]
MVVQSTSKPVNDLLIELFLLGRCSKKKVQVNNIDNALF